MPSRDIPDVHICIVQPPGYLYSMALLDPARYLQYQFARLGVRASIAKNRLRKAVPNLVLGAHLGFDASLLREYACVLLNLEQLGEGGTTWWPKYADLLRSAPVIDYHPANLAAYGRAGDAVPIVRFGYAPYLAAEVGEPIPIEARPIDLLFFGSINDRRKRIFDRIESTGRVITLFDGPVFGPERDAFVRQARAVLNCHYYETARFEQVRAFQVLSLGTPLVSESSPDAASGAGFESSVSWFSPDRIEDFFSREYAAAAFAERARGQIEGFRASEAPPGYEAALQLLLRARPQGGEVAPPQRCIRVVGGDGYQTGSLNLSPDPADQADLTIDLCEPLSLPVQLDSAWRGRVELHEGSSEVVHLGAFPDSAGAARTLLANCLRLLRPGGLLVVDQPVLAGAANGPDDSWLPACTNEFWRMAWLDHRLKERECLWCDGNGTPVPRQSAALRRIQLEKVATTLAERTFARVMSPDFAGAFDVQGAAPAAPSRTTSAPVATAGGPQDAIVSVVITTFRRPKTLPRAVASVITQRHEGFAVELIVSDDDPAQSAQAYVNAIPASPGVSIRYLGRGSDTGGVSASRNRATMAASGQWLIYLDDDDALLPEALQSLLAAAQRERATVAIGNYLGCLEAADGRILSTQRHEFPPGFGYASLRVRNFIPVGAYLIQRSAIRVPFDVHLKSLEDWLFLLDNLADQRIALHPGFVAQIFTAAERDRVHRNTAGGARGSALDILRVYSLHPDAALVDSRRKLLAALPELGIEELMGGEPRRRQNEVMETARQGRFLIVNPDEAIQKKLLENGEYQLLGPAIALAMSSLRAGCIVDVGANIGTFTLPVARGLPAHPIIAIEPQPFVFRHLGANALLNNARNASLLQIALGGPDGPPAIRLPLFDAHSDRGPASLPRVTPLGEIRSRIEQMIDPGPGAQEFVEVPLLTLDAILAGVEAAFVKIDAEGQELEVLRGGERELRRQRPSLYFEASALSSFAEHDRALSDFLLGLGYRIYQLGSNRFAFHPGAVDSNRVEAMLKRLGLNAILAPHPGANAKPEPAQTGRPVRCVA